MRIIKFRAWDKRKNKGCDTKEMLYDAQNHNLWRDFVDYPEIYELMEFTGLKDKDGREIYEGDVIDSCYYYDYEEPWGGQNSALDDFRGKIEYDNENACFYIKAQTLQSGKKLFNQIELKETKIIGNIHENPELLK